MQYKVGDRVVIKESNIEELFQHAGETGVIMEVWDTGDGFPYRVKTDNTEVCVWSAVELVEEKKVFTKKDLKNGDVLLCRDGHTEILVLPLGTRVVKGGYNFFSDIKDDLTHLCRSDSDIMAVRRPIEPMDCRFSAFDWELGELVFERDTRREMTIEEIEKEFGVKVKV